MQAAVLDTLRCAQTLKTAGFPQEQADAMAQVLGDALTDVATKTQLDGHAAMQKADLENAITGLRSELLAEIKIDGVDGGLNGKIDGVEARLKAKINGVEARLKAKIARVEAKLDHAIELLKAEIARVETKIDGVEQRLSQQIKDEIKGLTRSIYILIGVVLTMLATVFGFGFAAWASAPSPPFSESQADTAPPQPLSEPEPRTPPPTPDPTPVQRPSSS